MDITRSLHIARDGRKTLADTWVSPTALRPLISEDPCLVWLAHHGAAHGFAKDPEEYSLLGWLGEQGARFEEEWLRRVGGEDVVVANEHDHDVRHARALLRTAEAIIRQSPVISKAALWWAPDGLYGTADVLARVSWLRERLPATRLWLEGEDADSYVVMDCKMQSGLDTPAKRLDLRLASTQVRLYSHMVGHLFGSGKLARHAFIISRDRVLDPLPVEVGDPLNEETRALIDLYRRIRAEGAGLLPWRDDIVAPNPWNKKNAPWSEAVRTIVAERMPHRSLHAIPYCGRRAAEAIREAGYESVDDLPAAAPDALRRARIPGLGPKRLARAEAILLANRDPKRFETVIPPSAVPPRVPVEIMVDFEFVPGGVKPDFASWPQVKSREMVFMVGAGYEQGGRFCFEEFVAANDTPEAERAMWKEFILFLRRKGVVFGSVQEATVCPEGRAALYHWSPAEVHQSRRAAKRVGLEVLGDLPWVDLAKSYTDGPIALPGQWDYSPKSVAKAVGELYPEHRTEYPENLKVGSNAMVMALRAYERGGDVVNSDEFKTVAAYLEVDCRSTYELLRFLRASVSGGEEDSSPRAVKGRFTGAAVAGPGGWYRRSLALMAGQDFARPA